MTFFITPFHYTDCFSVRQIGYGGRFFDGSMLTAVMDLILKYPNDETAFIGLFMVDSASQGKGTGTAIIEECLCFLKRQGLRRARLGFAKGNCQSEAF